MAGRHGRVKFAQFGSGYLPANRRHSSNGRRTKYGHSTHSHSRNPSSRFPPSVKSWEAKSGHTLKRISPANDIPVENSLESLGARRPGVQLSRVSGAGTNSSWSSPSYIPIRRLYLSFYERLINLYPDQFSLAVTLSQGAVSPWTRVSTVQVSSARRSSSRPLRPRGWPYQHQSAFPCSTDRSRTQISWNSGTTYHAWAGAARVLPDNVCRSKRGRAAGSLFVKISQTLRRIKHKRVGPLLSGILCSCEPSNRERQIKGHLHIWPH